MSTNNNNGNSSSSAHHNADTMNTYPDDDDVERTLLINLRRQLVGVRAHYADSHGRILRARLEAIQSLADERLRDLDEWATPEAGDAASVAAYIATTSFIRSLRRILARMWISYRTKNSRISKKLVREMGRLVEARFQAI